MVIYQSAKNGKLISIPAGNTFKSEFIFLTFESTYGCTLDVTINFPENKDELSIPFGNRKRRGDDGSKANF